VFCAEILKHGDNPESVLHQGPGDYI